MTKPPRPLMPPDASADAAPMTDMPQGTAQQPPWMPVPQRTERGSAETVRRALLATAVAGLIISLAVAYFSANSIVSIWFEEQWVPVARLVLALLVAGIAAWCIVRLTRRMP